MAFSSLDFLLLFGGVWAAHWLLPPRARPACILAVSYGIYAYLEPRHLPLMAGITLVSYFAGREIAAGRGKARAGLWLGAAIALHVGVIIAWKAPAPWNHQGVWRQPLGLSYYTFQSIGYLVDVYRGGPLAPSLRLHALFLTFFPQLPCGPVERAKRIYPQWSDPAPWDGRRMAEGLYLLLWGAFQKVVLADSLAVAAARLFDSTASPAALEVLLGSYAFALQLYCDLAGYSDMAVGFGKCLGVDLVRNFDRPFLAQDMREFWRRWHISVTSWFTDYVYRPLLELPLPGKLYAAPMITLALMGLWHGLSPTMALMGLFFGGMIAASLAWSLDYSDRLRLPPWLARLAVFHVVCLGLVFFRAASWDRALALLRGLGDFRHVPGVGRTAAWLAFFGWPVAFRHAMPPDDPVDGALRLKWPVRAVWFVVLVYGLVIFGNDETRDYIYAAF